MTAAGGGNERAAEGIFRYLVRYGIPGHVGRFGSIHRLELRRGDDVLVRTDRGLERGTLLVNQPDNEADARPPTGELLRKLAPEELPTHLQGPHAQGPREDTEIRRIAQRLLAEKDTGITLVDSETLFDGRTVIVYFLGPPSMELGRLATQLAQRHPAFDIRFENLADAERAEPPVAAPPHADAHHTDAHHTDGSANDTPHADAPHADVDQAAAAAGASSRPGGSRLSPWERLKAGSRGLRGDLPVLLRSSEASNESSPAGSTPLRKFPRDAARLLQFHGVYQQRFRDRSPASSTADPPVISRAAGKPPAVESQRPAATPASPASFMIRVKADGGRLTAGQLGTLLDLADSIGQGDLRITSRQGIQLHGLAGHSLRDGIQRIQERLLTTFGACGDTNRNVMCCPAPLPGTVRRQLQVTAGQIARHLAPRSEAYFEIWLGDEQLAGEGAEGEEVAGEWIGAGEAADGADGKEPIYGRTYLPRKFKIAVGLPEDNCVEVFTQDIGLLAVVEPRDSAAASVVGYDVLVGGGLGVSPKNERTFPRLADPLGFCEYGDVLRVVTALVELYRDHGNRSDRRRARFKYLVDEWGVGRLRDTLADYLQGKRIAAPRGVRVEAWTDHLGWHAQGDGNWFLGVPVPSGRLEDREEVRLKSALRACLKRFAPAVRLTPQQNLLLTGIADQQRGECERLLRDHGVVLAEGLTPLRRQAMACPALPTCGLAITEAERVLPRILDALAAELRRQGWEDADVSVRVTGCPNGCARPYTGEIGLVGVAADRYAIYLGGSPLGDRLAIEAGPALAAGEIVSRLRPVLSSYRDARRPGERFGDYCRRMGRERLEQLLRPPSSAGGGER